MSNTKEKNLSRQVENQQKTIDALSRQVKTIEYASTPIFSRYERKQNVSPEGRFRIEPYQGSALPDKCQVGEMLFFGGVLYIGIEHDIWGNPVRTAPFEKTIAVNTDDMSIVDTTINAMSNYIILNNSTAGSLNLTGLSASNVDAGYEMLLLNKSAQDIVIKNNTTSSAANRFFTLSGADVTLNQHESIKLIYRADSTRTAWQEI